eukprot:scaffold1.g5744.t1
MQACAPSTSYRYAPVLASQPLPRRQHKRSDRTVRTQAVQAPTRSNVANVTDVGLKDVPLRSLFPEEPGPPAPGAPKLKARAHMGAAAGPGVRAAGEATSDAGGRVAIVGSGLAGLSTAVELLDQGYEVDIYESRSWVGGKVASFRDKNGNDIEMGLHVFFGWLMAKCGVLENLLLKEHTHTFCNKGGDVRDLDFRFYLGDTKIGAPFHGLRAFFTTPQLSTADKIANSLALGTSPIVRSLFDPEVGSEGRVGGREYGRARGRRRREHVRPVAVMGGGKGGAAGNPSRPEPAPDPPDPRARRPGAQGGMRDVRALDDISFADWFKSHGGSQASIERMWDPIAYALGFLDCKDISARCMLSIFQFFATKTDASALRMLNGSPAERLLKPITDYIKARGGRIHTRWGCREVLYEAGPDGRPATVSGLRLTKARKEQLVTADAYVAALDAWRADPFFDNVFRLVGVPVITVQLRYDGWVTEMADPTRARQLGAGAAGLDNLLYSADADFSCFADLALTSPVDYYRPDSGSLMQCVLTPADPYLPRTNEEIIAAVDKQVRALFPSAAGLKLLWHSVVKIGQSLYREAPGMDPFRPDQRTPVPNFFLAGSYTKQDYIDSMEGATLSGRQCAYKLLEAAPQLAAAKAAKAAAAVSA